MTTKRRHDRLSNRFVEEWQRYSVVPCQCHDHEQRREQYHWHRYRRSLQFEEHWKNDRWILVFEEWASPLTLEVPVEYRSNKQKTRWWALTFSVELTKLNLPSILLSAAISRSPWWTLISTCVCPSAAVEKTYATPISFKWLLSLATDLTLLGWNRGVTIDQFGKNATQGFDTQRQWRDVEKKKICHIATEHTTLEGRDIQWYGEVEFTALRTWIAAPMATASSGLTDLFGALPNNSCTVCWTWIKIVNWVHWSYGECSYFGHTGHTTDQDDFVDICCFDIGIFDGFLAWIWTEGQTCHDDYHCLNIPIVRLIRWATRFSNWERVIL